MAERTVVVGAGSISNSWFPALLAEGVDIPFVVDLNPEAARGQIEKYDLKSEATADLSGAIRRAAPDFVLDLTVPEAHGQVTCTALEAGCHVLGEKPMAPTMAEARRMVEAAERSGKLYVVSQNRRWDPPHEALRQAAIGGLVGDLTTLNCDFYLGAHFGGFRDEMASPLLLDMAIHHFDLARFFSGVEPVAVYAHEFSPKGSWYAGEVAASCIFEMSEGVVFTYRGSWCSEGFTTSWNGNWRAIGDRGTILYEQDVPPRAQVVDGDTGMMRPLREVSVPVPPLPAVGMHGALREMLAYLRTGSVPQTECHDNLKSLAMVHAAIESARRRERVPVEID